jgi:hypothetical protein
MTPIQFQKEIRLREAKGAAPRPAQRMEVSRHAKART